MTHPTPAFPRGRRRRIFLAAGEPGALQRDTGFLGEIGEGHRVAALLSHRAVRGAEPRGDGEHPAEKPPAP